MLDVFLVAAIILGSAGWLLASRANSDLGYSNQREATVYHDGVIGERLMLDTDSTVPLLQGKMVLEVSENRIRIKQSDCPRQFCVNQGWVKYDGETIVCVPFKTLIEIQSPAAPMVDAVVY